jgi:hypothetical protein
VVEDEGGELKVEVGWSSISVGPIWFCSGSALAILLLEKSAVAAAAAGGKCSCWRRWRPACSPFEIWEWEWELEFGTLKSIPASLHQIYVYFVNNF